MLIGTIRNEWHKLQILPVKTRRLFLVYGLRGIAQPLLTLFVDAYIWRYTGSVDNIILYNLGFFLTLPAGFFVNGLLLKKISVVKSHFIGLLLSAISASSVVFFSDNYWLEFLIYGLFFGLGGGIYWSSRNYLNFQETVSDQRNYFIGITMIIDGLTAGIAVPLLAGWAIMAGEIYHWYSPLSVYWFLATGALFFLIFSGLKLLPSNYQSPIIGKIWQRSISKRWNAVRLADFGLGLVDGVSIFLSTILILSFLGKEGVLGSISAFVSLITIVAIYFYSRLSRPRHRKPVYVLAILAFFVCALILALAPRGGVIFYVLLGGLPLTFQWLAIDPWFMDITNRETDGYPEKRYTLIFDRELFLNLGRIAGVVLLFILINFIIGQDSLRFTPLVLVVGQIIFLSCSWRRIQL